MPRILNRSDLIQPRRMPLHHAASSGGDGETRAPHVVYSSMYARQRRRELRHGSSSSSSGSSSSHGYAKDKRDRNPAGADMGDSAGMATKADARSIYQYGDYRKGAMARVQSGNSWGHYVDFDPDHMT
mmetsp:Transcript_900/g.2551  ORF Transcript_900/g.2551 Transcript_900/m.2551 type:complete len:128 (+) Transcript_900:176-559(+)